MCVLVLEDTKCYLRMSLVSSESVYQLCDVFVETLNYHWDMLLLPPVSSLI
jgi:hypothetical protein